MTERDDLRDPGAGDIDLAGSAMVIGIASSRCRVFHHGRELDCVDKIDLVPPEERATELAPLDTYRALDVPVIACSARGGDGLDALRGAVRGMTCALVGHSGVGKSSILNALDQRLQLATGDLHR